MDSSNGCGGTQAALPNEHEMVERFGIEIDQVDVIRVTRGLTMLSCNGVEGVGLGCKLRQAFKVRRDFGMSLFPLPAGLAALRQVYS